MYLIKTIFTVTYFKNVSGEKENQNDLHYRLFNKCCRKERESKQYYYLLQKLY